MSTNTALREYDIYTLLIATKKLPKHGAIGGIKSNKILHANFETASIVERQLHLVSEMVGYLVVDYMYNPKCTAHDYANVVVSVVELLRQAAEGVVKLVEIVARRIPRSSYIPRYLNIIITLRCLHRIRGLHKNTNFTSACRRLLNDHPKLGEALSVGLTNSVICVAPPYNLIKAAIKAHLLDKIELGNGLFLNSIYVEER